MASRKSKVPIMSGFVYVWFDRKHKRYYVGSHWGTPDDGYVCSSSWMKRAYKRRPEDFRRRIIAWSDNRRNLLIEEYRWLSMIKQEELRNRYYNMKIGSGHWHADEEKRLTVNEKISIGTKAAMNTEEGRLRNLEGQARRDKTWTEERRERQRATMTETMRRKHGPKKVRAEQNSEEHKKLMSEGLKRHWETRPRNPITVRGMTFPCTSEAASHFGVTPGAIYQWRRAEGMIA